MLLPWALKKQREITKSEMNVCGPDVTAEIDGSLKKKELVQKYNRHIKMEIKKTNNISKTRGW